MQTRLVVHRAPRSSRRQLSSPGDASRKGCPPDRRPLGSVSRLRAPELFSVHPVPQLGSPHACRPVGASPCTYHSSPRRTCKDGGSLTGIGRQGDAVQLAAADPRRPPSPPIPSASSQGSYLRSHGIGGTRVPPETRDTSAGVVDVHSDSVQSSRRYIITLRSKF